MNVRGSTCRESCTAHRDSTTSGRTFRTDRSATARLPTDRRLARYRAAKTTGAPPRIYRRSHARLIKCAEERHRKRPPRLPIKLVRGSCFSSAIRVLTRGPMDEAPPLAVYSLAVSAGHPSQHDASNGLCAVESDRLRGMTGFTYSSYQEFVLFTSICVADLALATHFLHPI